MSVRAADLISTEARVGFKEGLLSRGFIHCGGDEFSGAVNWRDSDDAPVTSSVTIVVPPDFPISYPRVIPDPVPGPSWHLDRDGAMCLWTRGQETADLPWISADTLLTRVDAWLEGCARSWVETTPDLDLERYIEPGLGLVIYSLEDLDGFDTARVKVVSRRVP